MKEVYQIAPKYPAKQLYFGNWSYQKGLNFPRKNSRFFRRTDLEGLEIKIGYIHKNYPFTQMNSYKSRDLMTGFFGDVWRVLEDAMNIR